MHAMVHMWGTKDNWLESFSLSTKWSRSAMSPVLFAKF